MLRLIYFFEKIQMLIKIYKLKKKKNTKVHINSHYVYFIDWLWKLFCFNFLNLLWDGLESIIDDNENDNDGDCVKL